MFQNYERREGNCSAQLFDRSLKNLGSRHSAQPQNENKYAKTNPKPCFSSINVTGLKTAKRL